MQNLSSNFFEKMMIFQKSPIGISDLSKKILNSYGFFNRLL